MEMEYHHKDNAEERGRKHDTTRFIVLVVAIIAVLALGIVVSYLMKPSEESEVRVSNQLSRKLFL